MGHFNFILGSAGCGKSGFIYQTLTRRTLEEPDRQFYLFVPEQNTLKAQQELIRHSPVHGMLSLDVLSFTRLSYRIMEELNIPVPDVLDEVSKSVLMRKALSEVKDRLTVYRQKTGSKGFVNQLKSAFSEFVQYGVDGDALREAAKRAETPLLAGKLRDVELVFGKFRELLSGDGSAHVIPEEIPELLLKNIGRSRLLDGAVLVFDGFTGFTPVQLSIIGRMAEKAEQLSFAVTLPASQLHVSGSHYTDLFWFSREMVKKVTDTCTRAGILQNGNVCLPDRKGRETALSGHLRVPGELKTQVLGFEDPTEEIRYLASAIRRKAVSGNARYCRMAVAVSDLPAYREIIRREFTAAGIPFFLDDRASAEGSPVVELLRSALLIIRDNFEYEDVMTFLKNPCVSGDDSDFTDRADNFIRAAGLRGKKAYLQDWSERSYIPDCAGDDLPGLEAWKQRKLKEVFRLREELKTGKTCGEKAKAAAAFLERMNPEEKELTEDDRRFLELSRELFERLDSLFSPEEISVKDFSDLVEAGFSDMKAGVIPGGMDALNVGDLKRSRFDDIDDLYLVGANEGKIPQTVSGGGLFTDAERMALGKEQLELAPDDRHDAVIQSFYLYLYLHKPVRELTVSFSMQARDGSRMKPSALLEGAAVTYPGQEPATMQLLLGEFAALAARWEEGRTAETENLRLQEDWALLSADPQTAAAAEAVLNAALKKHAKEELTGETAGLLYGKELSGSITRLEQFESCPYSHFLNYGLQLSERETFDVEAVDLGRIYHSALDRVLRELKERGRTLGDVSAEELKKLAGEKVAEVTEGFQGDALTGSARNRYVSEQVRRITEKTLEKLSQQYRAGSFETAETEVPFTSEFGGMRLNGRIDRIDKYTDGDTTWIKVIDYKSGSAEFNVGLCYEGIQMQLAAYMREALEKEERRGHRAEPAGMFLYHIKDPVVRASEPEKAEENFRMDGLCTDDPRILAKMDIRLEEGESSCVIPVRMKDGIPTAASSVMNREQFRLLLERSRQQMVRDAERIRKGEITAEPAEYSGHSGCDYCPMKAVCGFDHRISGYEYRRIEVPKKSVVIEKLENQA